MSEQKNWAQAIVDAHPELSISDGKGPGKVALNSTNTDAENTVYGAAKAACLALGFIDIDAECIATAWDAMASRTGQFDPLIWPSEAQDFGVQPWPRENAFPACPHKLGLYAVLPDAAWVKRMAHAGVPTVQLRFKSDDARAIEHEVQAAVQAVQGTQALLFINDHWQAAIAAGAYGVHLGQEDLEEADLKAIRDANLRLGLSSHGYAEMLRADAFSPSYIALGAVYPTTLKRMVTAPQGAGRLSAYAKLMADYPLVAIGGIDKSRLTEVLASGVGSVAVVRALVAAEHPEQEAASFQAALSAKH
jgi:thiamine-phosphate pyrophosphorylase